MSPPRRPGARPPYWTVPAFLILLAVPGPWLGLGLAALAVVTAVRVARRAAARRALQAGPPAGAVRLGVDRTDRALDLGDRQLAAHGLIVGASGAGKSTTLLRILTDRVERGLPVVAVDLKGSPTFAATLRHAAVTAGRPFVLWTPDGPAHWNPLARGNPTELKDKLMSTERFSEPHYQKAAERYLQTALRVLAAAHPDQAPTLREVVAVMEPRRLASALRGVDPATRAGVQDYIENLGPDQLSAVRGLGTRLAILTESHTGPFLESPAPGRPAPIVDLPGALRGDAVVVYSLNSSSLGKLAAQLGTVVVQDVIAAAGERLHDSAAATGSPPALVAIDEFSALGADHLVNLFARARESGIGVLLSTQEMADLDRAAAGLRDQIIGNTAVKIVHRQEVPASAQLVARMTGTERVVEEVRHFGGELWRTGFGPRGTRREVEQFRVHPNDIMSLRTGEAVVITKVPSTSVNVVSVSPPAPRRPDVRPAPASDPVASPAGRGTALQPSRPPAAARPAPASPRREQPRRASGRDGLEL